jgi:phage FluMu protein Com
MPIEFRCSACNKLLRTPDETAGKQAKCPECGVVTQIPAATPPAEENPFAAGDSPSAPPPWDPATESPFSPDVPSPEGAPDSDNPYQSPADYQRGPAAGFATNPELIAYARARVSGPAIGLIVTGALGLLAQILALVVNVAQLGMQGMPGGGPNPAIMMVSGGANVFFGIVAIVLAVLLIVAGMKMNKLENYGLSMTAAIIGMVPCFSPCCLLGLPFGIWALVVLSDGRVQAAFSTVKAGN